MAMVKIIFVNVTLEKKFSASLRVAGSGTRFDENLATISFL